MNTTPLTQSISFDSKSLISLFEENVQLYPNKTAIFHNEQSISYEDLNCKANAIADYLFKLGVKEGSIVAILLERSINLIAGILGVLKTGGAYTVIDNDYPISRIEYIFNDTNSSLLLTDTAYQDQLKYKNLFPSYNCRYVYISHLVANVLSDIINPILQSNGNTLACVIYTSGSTGKPKGALLDHKAIFRLFNGSNMVQTSSSDCVSQTSNASFDAAIYEMWAALGKGGALVVIDKDTVLSSQALEKCFKKHHITTAFLTTGLFNQLANNTPTIFKSLKNAICAGEAANAEIIRKILSNNEFRPQKLFNLYGPTECAVFATYYEIKALDDDATSVPIGIPVNDTQIYILNDNLEKVQPGEIGELYIGGDGVARGYLNRPDLTEEKFILCPFEPGCKMYKTGDLVKTLSNGLIDFVGRKDNQVKIRGFRVELEEVESALESHTNILQGIVVASYTPQGHQQLVAYFIPKNEKDTIEVDSIRLHLKKILPDYMIPSIFVQLDSLPLTSHGKIDRHKLSDICLNQEVKVTEETRDLTSAERLLLAIWKSILRVSRIKLNDNFFNLGGDSLMIMQMISQAAEHRILLKYSLVLQHPTIKSLALLIEHNDHAIRKEFLINANLEQAEYCNHKDTIIDLVLTEYSIQDLHEIVPDIKEVQAVYPLTPIQEGFLFHAIHDPQSYAYFIQTYWRSQQKYNAKAMLKAWEILTNNHELLRASYLWEDLNHPIQIIHKQSNIAFTEKDWRMLLPEEQAAKLKDYFIEDRELGIEFKIPPFMRFVIIHTSDYEQIMIWSFHHIIMDGPSLFKVVEELDYYYSTLCSGNDVVLKPKPLFKDYIIWQKQQNQDINRLFWEDYLSGFHAPNQILFKKDFCQNTLSFNSCHTPLNYELSEEISELLHKYAQCNQLTLNTVMQGMWAYLLSCYCNTLDVVFGLTISIRPSKVRHVHRIVGPLIDTLPFRVKIDKDVYVLDYLKKVQGNLAAVIDHSFYPYVDIRKGAQISAGESLFNSSFCFESKQFEGIKKNLSAFYNINFNAMTHYPLSVYIIPGQCMEFKVNFDARLYSEDNVDKLMNNYINLLSDFMKNSTVALKEISCFSFQEFKHLTNHFNLEDNLKDLKSAGKIELMNTLEKQIQSQSVVNTTSKVLHSELEQRMATIWANVLHKTDVGIDDNFFELGGDSLIAIRLISRLRKELRIKVNIRNLLDAPTVRQLSNL